MRGFAPPKLFFDNLGMRLSPHFLKDGMKCQAFAPMMSSPSSSPNPSQGNKSGEIESPLIPLKIKWRVRMVDLSRDRAIYKSYKTPSIAMKSAKLLLQLLGQLNYRFHTSRCIFN